MLYKGAREQDFNVHHANMRIGNHKKVDEKLLRRPPTPTHDKYPHSLILEEPFTL